jgi:hypothetical protein
MQVIRVPLPAHWPLLPLRCAGDALRRRRVHAALGLAEEAVARLALVAALLLAPLPAGPQLSIGAVQAAVVMR